MLKILGSGLGTSSNNTQSLFWLMWWETPAMLTKIHQVPALFLRSTLNQITDEATALTNWICLNDGTWYRWTEEITMKVNICNWKGLSDKLNDFQFKRRSSNCHNLGKDNPKILGINNCRRLASNSTVQRHWVIRCSPEKIPDRVRIQIAQFW